jgi:hypothetical protein
MGRDTSHRDLVFGGSTWNPDHEAADALRRRSSEAAGPFSQRHCKPSPYSGYRPLGSSSAARRAGARQCQHFSFPRLSKISLLAAAQRLAGPRRGSSGATRRSKASGRGRRSWSSGARLSPPQSASGTTARGHYLVEIAGSAKRVGSDPGARGHCPIGQPLLASFGPALVGRARETGIARDGPSVPELP